MPLVPEKPSSSPEPRRAEGRPPPRVAVPAPAAPVRARPASSRAVKATTLAELKAELDAFDGCSLKSTATSLCLFRGAEQARLMIIGEAPGRDEDLAGKPFVGRAGQLLDKMLAAIGLTEERVHITNVIYWRPPGNRTPTPAETLSLAPFVTRQIELVAPDVLLLLGGVAAKQILDVQEGITTIRGKWFETISGGRAIRTIASLHPAYLLRTPAAKRQAWQDFLLVKEALGTVPR